MRGSAAVSLALLMGCSSFGSGSVPTPEADAGSGGDATVAPDAGDGGDASTVTPLLCAGATCAANQTCCVGKATRSCNTLCPGFDLQCLGSKECREGEVCCFGAAGAAARCQTMCPNGRILCDNEADCVAANEKGTCQSTTCSSASMNFKVCARGGSKNVDPSGDTGTCSFP